MENAVSAMNAHRADAARLAQLLEERTAVLSDRNNEATRQILALNSENSRLLAADERKSAEVGKNRGEGMYGMTSCGICWYLLKIVTVVCKRCGFYFPFAVGSILMIPFYS